MTEQMPKEQYEYIKRIQDDMLYFTNMTENEAWDFAFRCWQCGYTKEVESEYNNGWIPCEVELPKIATSYLVAEEVIVNSKKLYVVDIRLFGTEDEWLCPSNRKIIAWQPLPQPPKGE